MTLGITGVVDFVHRPGLRTRTLCFGNSILFFYFQTKEYHTPTLFKIKVNN
jgi:hypothetical protein